ncbi:virulence-associated E family protein [Ruegeria conchae]|uniref:virulence-associated E family protein n=1 Tax=Ruegeria conchae TaxID=981384 RepID=UPI0021A4BC03|nr:virulence-associated E family protein [Ruegeria conchae]UWR04736.1 virulence-associated E family protein [Ruegeria conchae]
MAQSNTGFLVTVVTKANNGPMTKSIKLNGSGLPHSDGGLCRMSDGSAQVVPVRSPGEFADLLNGLDSSQAITLGVVKDDPLNGTVWGVVADHAVMPGVISRTQKFFTHQIGQGVMLIDFDQKQMPDKVRKAVTTHGAEKLIFGQIPGTSNAAYVMRNSTSFGLKNTATGQTFDGSGGFHLYLMVLDATDIPRALSVLYKRLWLAGYGWHMVGKRGALHDRTLVDQSVGGPERLIFEGPPIITPPLAQDQAARQASVMGGNAVIDTRAALPDLTHEEEARFAELVRASKDKMSKKAKATRDTFVQDEALRTGRTVEAVRTDLELADGGRLSLDFVLHFDDPNIGQKTVREVVTNLAAFEGKTLGDPMDPEDGRGKAKILAGTNGVINSFAHGGGRYQMDLTPEAVGAHMVAAGGPTQPIMPPGVVVEEAPTPLAEPLQFITKEDGRWVDNVANVVMYLTHGGMIRDCFAHNELTHQNMLTAPIPESGIQDMGRAFTDEDITDVQTHIQKYTTLQRVSLDKVNQAVNKVCMLNRYDPLADYLRGLVWDQKPRLDRWLFDLLKIDPNPPTEMVDLERYIRYVQNVGRKWLISGVARAIMPGCKVDTSLIIEGPQGIGKSSALAALVPDPTWFGDSLPAFKGKESDQYLAGKWLIEIAELASVKKSEIEDMRAFLTRQTDDYRPPWGRHNRQYPRRLIFAGTTNREDYLRDMAGERRFWITRGTNKMDVNGVNAARDQLWAEAFHAFNDGEQWFFEDDDISQFATKIQQSRVARTAWADLLEPMIVGYSEISITEAFALINVVYSNQDTAKTNLMITTLNQLGFYKDGRFTDLQRKGRVRYARK